MKSVPTYYLSPRVLLSTTSRMKDRPFIHGMKIILRSKKEIPLRTYTAQDVIDTAKQFNDFVNEK